MEEIAAGWGHTCARLASGKVHCWGTNKHGQLGQGPQGTMLQTRTTPAEVPGLEGVVELSLGGGHSCARMRDGTARCWGTNENGQLGDGTQEDRDAPVQVVDLAGAQRIAAGRAETCAVLADGSVRCWGGLTGSFKPKKEHPAPVARSIAPSPVPGLTDVTALALGAAHACALRRDGTVACWGENLDGQVGDGTTEMRPQPVAVQGVSDAIQIAAWMGSSCALLRGGGVVCWGKGSGTGGAPLVSAELHDVAELSGPCARGADGAVRCRRGERTDAIEGPRAARIAFGVAHGCLLTAAGEARCWGANRSGEIGDGTQQDRRRATAVVW